MSAWPAARAGVVAVIDVALATATFVAAAPIDTVAPAMKPVPAMVMFWPPVVTPTAGEMAVRVGAAAAGGGG
jgi:hypothetical protein